MLRAWRPWLVALLLGLGADAWATSQAVQSALELMNQGKLQKALDQLDDHLDSAPQDAEGRFTRGLVLVRMNRGDDAIKAFSDLTRDYPQLPEPYNNLAVLYAQQGDYDKAREALEAALASHPSYMTAHENLGDVYAALANAAYTRAIALDPKNSGIKAKLALVEKLEALADSGATVVARVAAATAKPEDTSPVSEADAAAVRQRVQDWAAAWSAKDADKYLAFYSTEFSAEAGGSRQTWEAQRRARIAKPKQIQVQVTDVQASRGAGGTVRTSFTQTYQSDVLSNTSTKVLEWRNDGEWRIVREYSR
ncbi:MAG TPA: tetratricopeptide repeat protein [Candidatus Binatia bacterium]|nr:tetratricopeptide repeat protein [Candidatus Binatia bacterium]